MRRNIRRSGNSLATPSVGSPATILVVSLILTIFASPGFAETAPSKKARQKSAKTAVANSNATEESDGTGWLPQLDETDLRYLPDDCCAIGRIDFARLLKSPVGQNWALPSDACAATTPINPKMEHIQHMVLGVRRFGSDGSERYVFAVHTSQPLVVSESHPSWTKETCGSHTIWLLEAQVTIALCAVEDKLFLAGSADTVREILLRNGPASLPPALAKTEWQPTPEACAAFSIIPTRRLFPVDFTMIPAAKELIEGIDTMNVEFQCDNDLEVQLDVLCHNEAAAQQFKGIAVALLAIIQAQNMTSAQLPLRVMADSLDIRVDQSTLTARMKILKELIQVTAGKKNNKNLVSPPTVTLASPRGNMAPGFLTNASNTTPTQPTGNPHVTSPYSPTPPSSYPAQGTVPPPTRWDPYAPTPPSSSSPPAGYTPYAPTIPNYCLPKPTTSLSTPTPSLALADVIRMSEAEVDEEVIMRHIRKHHLETPLTADDLILLTEKAVSKPVIMALQDLPSYGTKYGSPQSPSYPTYPTPPKADPKPQIIPVPNQS